MKRLCIAVMTCGLIIGLGAGMQVSAADGKAAQKNNVVLKGAQVLLPEIPCGSWCAGGENILEQGVETSAVGLALLRDGKGVTVRGHFRSAKSSRKRTAYKPAKYEIKIKKGVEQLAEKMFKSADLKAGVDLEVFTPDLAGPVVIRLEENWRGVIWGVISGWEFKLAAETLTLADADLDGGCSNGDRVIYGNRAIWMPWHTVTASGRFIYYDMAIAGNHSLSARIRPMDDPGVDAAVWDNWQEVRKDHGIPPGIFSKTLQSHCVAHANYLTINKVAGHDEDPKLPGYSTEGRQAGMTCCIGGDSSITIDKNAELRSHLATIYHRWRLIDPTCAGLQLGGNRNWFLMGTDLGPGLPDETRTCEQPACYPAPYSATPDGAFSVGEWPRHPAYDLSSVLGVPVTLSLRGERGGTLTHVQCQLYAVTGDMRTGQRGREVKCHLSYDGKGAPKEFPNNFGMLALTPLDVLKRGAYEADFRYALDGQEFRRQWRFSIGTSSVSQ